MAVICISHPDDPTMIWQVPDVKPPWTFEDVYGSAGYTLVPDCPPVPVVEGRGSESDKDAVPTSELRALLDSAASADKLEDK